MMHKTEKACIALHLTCLFTLTGSSVTFSSSNTDGPFECNTVITLSCHVQSYTSMSMFRNNSRLADCFFASCSTYSALQGYMNFAYDTGNGVFNVTINPITEKDNNISFRCSDGTNQASITPDVKVSNNATVDKRSDSFANGSVGLTATSGCVYTDSMKLKWTSQKVGEDTQNDIAADKLSTTYFTVACSSNSDCYNGNGTRQIQETGLFLPATFHNNHSVYVCFYNSYKCKPYEKFDGYFQIEGKTNKSNSQLTAILKGVLIPLVVIIVLVVVAVVICVPCSLCYYCNCVRKVKRIYIKAKTDLHPVVLEWSAPFIKKDTTQFMIICEEFDNQQKIKINTTEININQQQFQNLKCCVYGLTPQTTYRFQIRAKRSDNTLTAQSIYRKVHTLDIIRLEGEANCENEITVWWNSSCNLQRSNLRLTGTTITSKKPLNKIKNEDIYIDDVDYSKSLNFKGESYEIALDSKAILNGTYTIKGLTRHTRYVFFITMTKGTSVTQSNALQIQTLELKLEKHHQERTNENTAFELIGTEVKHIQPYKTFVKVDQETPKLVSPNPTLDPQKFEIDGLDPKKSTCIWITTVKNTASNIITIHGREELEHKLGCLRPTVHHRRMRPLKREKVSLVQNSPGNSMSSTPPRLVLPSPRLPTVSSVSLFGSSIISETPLTSRLAQASDSRIFTLLESLREDVKENKCLLKLILLKGGTTADDIPACLPDGLNIPPYNCRGDESPGGTLSVPESFSSVGVFKKILLSTSQIRKTWRGGDSCREPVIGMVA